jgi:tRNA threonylcarbamoyl adenosine modification protein (Sua5/YciO/YrdC/YwlC family)
MAILDAIGDPVPAAALRAAAQAVAGGLIVGIPTDTVYGLAVNPFVPGAADRLFAAKRRPRDVELPVLVATVDQALDLATAVPRSASALMERFWPGPLTVVIPRRPDLGADLGSDDATIGVRCPNHPVPLALCAEAGPLATTSANLHGEPPSQTADAVDRTFGDAVAVVLDSGPATGTPSTVVDCTGVEPRLLRQGRVPWDEIMGVLT